MESLMLDKIVEAVSDAKDGILYDIKDGALCPFCKIKLRTVKTAEWLGSSRKRYHKCFNPKCPLHLFDQTIISWQDI